MTEVTIIKGSDLPLATSVSDVDDLLGIQSGVTKRFRRADVKGSATAGPLTTVVVDVTTSEEIAISAHSVIISAVLTGSGAAKVGTTTGAGDIIDEALVTGTAAVYAALGWRFAADDIIYFTGTFKIRLLIWNVGE